MALAKIDPNRPVNYGGATISPETAGSGVGNSFTTFADNRSITSLDGTTFAQELDGRYLFGKWLPKDPLAMTTADHAAGAASGDATITYPASGVYHRHAIYGVGWSYSATPAGGRVTVEDGAGNEIWGQQITAAGPGGYPFDEGKMGSPNRDLVVRLHNGGASVSGEVNVFGHRVL